MVRATSLGSHHHIPSRGFPHICSHASLFESAFGTSPLPGTQSRKPSRLQVWSCLQKATYMQPHVSSTRH